MINEFRLWENSKQDGGQGEVCDSEPVVQEQGENSGVSSQQRGCDPECRGGCEGGKCLARLATCHVALRLWTLKPSIFFLVRPQCHTMVCSSSCQPPPCPHPSHPHSELWLIQNQASISFHFKRDTLQRKSPVLSSPPLPF